MVGCLSSSSSLLGCCGCWEREGCWVVVATGKERENLKGERKKKNKLLMWQVCVYIYTFLYPLMWVVLEKNYVNFAQF